MFGSRHNNLAKRIQNRGTTALNNRDNLKQIKGIITVDFQITGLKDQAWRLLKVILGVIIFEFYHNKKVPETYLRVLVSEVFKKAESSLCTYLKRDFGSMLWGSVEYKWFTGSYLLPISHLNSTDTVHHEFFLCPTSNEVPIVKYSYKCVNESFSARDVSRMMDESFKLLEKERGSLKCTKVVKQLLELRESTIFYSHDQIITSIDMGFKIEGKESKGLLSELEESERELRNVDHQPSTSVMVYNRGRLTEEN